MDEGVVEGGEDTSNAENELTCDGGARQQWCSCVQRAREPAGCYLPSRAWGPKEMFSWAGRAVVFLGGILKLEVLVDWVVDS